MSILKQLTGAQRWVVILTGVTLVLAVGNLGKAIVAVQYAVDLPDLSTTAPLSYFAATGGFWGAVFLTCALGLSGFRDWGRWLTLTAVSLYQIHVWINHLLFNVSNRAREAAPRNLILTILLLFVFWGSLNLPPVRSVFDESERRE